MKLLIHAFIISLLLAMQPAYSKGEDVKVVLHLNDGFKLGHLRNSVGNIKTELGEGADIRVVVNGKAVKRLLRSNTESAKIVESVLSQNVPIGLCHNAVNNNKVKPEMLIEGLQILPTDGNVTVIKYQQQGYIYIKL